MNTQYKAVDWVETEQTKRDDFVDFLKANPGKWVQVPEHVTPQPVKVEAKRWLSDKDEGFYLQLESRYDHYLGFPRMDYLVDTGIKAINGFYVYTKDGVDGDYVKAYPDQETFKTELDRYESASVKGESEVLVYEDVRGSSVRLYQEKRAEKKVAPSKPKRRWWK